MDIGERYPTYTDQCLLIQRLLHDESYEAAPEDKEYAAAFEEAVLNRRPEPDSPRSSALMMAQSFKGRPVEEYEGFMRKALQLPVPGFEGMTFGERYFAPMVSLVEYLAENDFQVYICSGSERLFLRVMIEGVLDEWPLPSAFP